MADLKVYMLPDYRQDNPYQQLLADALEARGAEVRFAQGYRRVFPIFRGLAADFLEADVVHLHWPDQFYKGANRLEHLVYGAKLWLDLLLVRRWAKRRVVWTLHNYGRHDDPYPKLTLFFMRLWCRTVNQLVLLNASDCELVCERYRVPMSKLTVTLHGHYRSVYDAPLDKRTARDQLGLSSSGRVFLFLGMVKPYKGLEPLLTSWEKHSAEHPEDLLLIAGGASDETYGDGLAEKVAAFDGRARFDRGFVEGNQIRVYYSAADVAVLPFERITNSGSLLLAMTYCCPVVAPAFPVVKEVVGKADALCYSTGEENGLTDALNRAANCDLDGLRDLMENELRRFEWDAVAERTMEAYGDE